MPEGGQRVIFNAQLQQPLVDIRRSPETIPGRGPLTARRIIKSFIEGGVGQVIVEQGGKALLPTAQVFTTPGTKGMGRCVVGVATDDKQFLVVYGEEQPGPTYYQYHLFARIFDLDGTPIGPAQKLPLPFSYLLTLPECARGRLVWTGNDFVLFYFEQALNLGLGPMHMVRLSIQEP